MFSKAIILILSGFILSSCVTGPDGYFKKSANNKIFDRKGFVNGKRAPLYNKKFIAKAKQNVANDDYEIDEEEEYNDLLENENISQANRDMYRRILEQEVESKYLKKDAKEKTKKPYPVLVRNSPRSDAEYNDDSDLRAELDQIKAMLSETKNEMANYKCPTAQQIEMNNAKSSAKIKAKKNGVDESKMNVKEKLQPFENVEKKDSSPGEISIIEPVKSI
jgi:hypothetical protein